MEDERWQSAVLDRPKFMCARMDSREFDKYLWYAMANLLDDSYFMKNYRRYIGNGIVDLAHTKSMLRNDTAKIEGSGISVSMDNRYIAVEKFIRHSIEERCAEK
jgi:hypothetical protein